jgi:hypothetical protein
MKRGVLFLGIIVLFLAVGCAPRYPVTKVNTVDSRPTLSFVNAPEGAIVLVDNLKMGDAAQYTGKPKVLVIEPGTHEIVLIQNGNEVYRQTIFVESEHKVITIH